VNDTISLKNVGPSALVMRLDAWPNKVERKFPVTDFFKHSYMDFAFWTARGSVRVVRAASRSESRMLWCEVSKLCAPYVRMPWGAVAFQLTSSARMRKQTRNDGRVFGVPSQISVRVEHAVASAVEPAGDDRSNGVVTAKGSRSGPTGAPPIPTPRPAPALLALSRVMDVARDARAAERAVASTAAFGASAIEAMGRSALAIS
jgi:hypothetical protein